MIVTLTNVRMTIGLWSLIALTIWKMSTADSASMRSMAAHTAQKVPERPTPVLKRCRKKKKQFLASLRTRWLLINHGGRWIFFSFQNRAFFEKPLNGIEETRVWITFPERKHRSDVWKQTWRHVKLLGVNLITYLSHSYSIFTFLARDPFFLLRKKHPTCITTFFCVLIWLCFSSYKKNETKVCFLCFTWH